MCLKLARRADLIYVRGWLDERECYSSPLLKATSDRKMTLLDVGGIGNEKALFCL
jgi:hypothetical protein